MCIRLHTDRDPFSPFVFFFPKDFDGDIAILNILLAPGEKDNLFLSSRKKGNFCFRIRHFVIDGKLPEKIIHLKTRLKGFFKERNLIRVFSEGPSRFNYEGISGKSRLRENGSARARL